MCVPLFISDSLSLVQDRECVLEVLICTVSSGDDLVKVRPPVRKVSVALDGRVDLCQIESVRQWHGLLEHFLSPTDEDLSALIKL